MGGRWYKIYGKSGIVPEGRARKKWNIDRKKGRKTEIRGETEKVGWAADRACCPMRATSAWIWGRSPLHANCQVAMITP